MNSEIITTCRFKKSKGSSDLIVCFSYSILRCITLNLNSSYEYILKLKFELRCDRYWFAQYVHYIYPWYIVWWLRWKLFSKNWWVWDNQHHIELSFYVNLVLDLNYYSRRSVKVDQLLGSSVKFSHRRLVTVIPIFLYHLLPLWLISLKYYEDVIRLVIYVFFVINQFVRNIKIIAHSSNICFYWFGIIDNNLVECTKI